MIYISTSCIKCDSIRESIEQLASMGYRNIELSGGTKYYSKYLEDVVKLKSKYDLKYLVHNYFPPQKEEFVLNFISDNSAVYQKSKKLIKDAISIAKQLDSSLYAFHPGYTVELNAEKRGMYFDYKVPVYSNKKKKESIFYERLEELINELKSEHVLVAIENLFPFSREEDYSLVSHPDEIIKFLQRYSSNPCIGMLLDLGHLNVAGYYWDFDCYKFCLQLLNEFSHKIFAIHLSENDGTGDQHQQNIEDSWQISLIKEMQNTIRETPITLEWHNPPNITYGIDRLHKIIGNVC